MCCQSKCFPFFFFKTKENFPRHSPAPAVSSCFIRRELHTLIAKFAARLRRDKGKVLLAVRRYVLHCVFWKWPTLSYINEWWCALWAPREERTERRETVRRKVEKGERAKLLADAMLILVVNLTGFRITEKANFWACLWEHFQGGMTELERLTLDVGRTNSMSWCPAEPGFHLYFLAIDSMASHLNSHPPCFPPWQIVLSNHEP
jgi:hypothetical protein